MVNFKKTSFVIEVETGTTSEEAWLETHEELLDLLACADAGMTTGKIYYRVYKLLQAMMPEWEMAKKMTR